MKMTPKQKQFRKIVKEQLFDRLMPNENAITNEYFNLFPQQPEILEKDDKEDPLKARIKIIDEINEKIFKIERAFKGRIRLSYAAKVNLITYSPMDLSTICRSSEALKFAILSKSSKVIIASNNALPPLSSVIKEPFDNNLFKIRKIDTDITTGMKRGYFSFVNQILAINMKMIMLRHNVEVICLDESFKDLKLYSSVSNDIKITRDLERFEMSGTVEFKLEGRRGVISSN